MAKKLLKDWVYRNLEKYKNTAISDLTFNKFGEERILADLKKHGFNCKIRKHEMLNPLSKSLNPKYEYKDVFYVIEVVKS